MWKSGRKCGILLARCVQRDLSPPNRPQGASCRCRRRSAARSRRRAPVGGGDPPRPVPGRLPAVGVGAARGPARARCPRSAGRPRRSRASSPAAPSTASSTCRGGSCCPRPCGRAAGLEREALVIGVLNRFEVWAPDAVGRLRAPTPSACSRTPPSTSQWPLPPPASRRAPARPAIHRKNPSGSALFPLTPLGAPSRLRGGILWRKVASRVPLRGVACRGPTAD